MGFRGKKISPSQFEVFDSAMTSKMDKEAPRLGKWNTINTPLKGNASYDNLGRASQLMGLGVNFGAGLIISFSNFFPKQ